MARVGEAAGGWPVSRGGEKKRNHERREGRAVHESRNKMQPEIKPPTPEQLVLSRFRGQLLLLRAAGQGALPLQQMLRGDQRGSVAASATGRERVTLLTGTRSTLF